jgi:chaperone modulatory protein CbpM
MSARGIVTLGRVCEHYRVDLELVRDFADFGLYRIVSSDGEAGIEERSLPRFEKVISLYRALGINKEGIDVVLELREKISELQAEIEFLRGGTESSRGLGLMIDVDD